jgi:hypothetical protein
MQCNAAGLQAINNASLEKAFQVTESNPVSHG